MQIQKTKSLTKREIVDLISRRSVVSKKQAEDFLGCFLMRIIETLRDGRSVQLTPFGTFGTRIRKEKRGRNPKTGALITIPETRVAFFRAGRWLRKNLG